MGQTKKAEKGLMITFVVAVFAIFAGVLAIGPSREVFKALSNAHPYLMGFVKFALLATAGELIAIRMASGTWKKPVYLMARLVIWGVIGVWITYMMKMFFIGSGALMEAGLLPGKNAEGFLKTFLQAFYTSATMNLSFGPTFMAIHKCSDAFLALRADQGKGVKIAAVIDSVDWKKFASFTIGKTVPFFWIPAHTLTFLLPAEYQVMLAALLSVALGIILNLNKNSSKDTKKAVERKKDVAV